MKVKRPKQGEIEITNSWSVWEKEISEFPWEYEKKETCYILEGKAEVISENGDKITFVTGDMVEFEKGLKCTRKIITAVKKKYKFG